MGIAEGLIILPAYNEENNIGQILLCTLRLYRRSFDKVNLFS